MPPGKSGCLEIIEVEEMETIDIDKSVRYLMITVFFGIIILIPVISYLIWPEMLIEAIIESLIFGIIFIIFRKRTYESLKSALLQVQEREQSNKKIKE